MECKVVNYKGTNAVEINGKVYPPVSFKTFRACDRNIADFYKAGVQLFCILDSGIENSLGTPYSLFGESWKGDYEYDFDVIDRQIDLFIKNAPDGYFAIMLSVDTRKWFLDARNGYPHSFYKLSQMESDSEWREKAGKYLTATIKHIEEKYGEKFFAYFILCGGTTEWFSEKSYEEPSEFSLASYKEWCGNDNVTVPSKEVRDSTDGVFVTGEDSSSLIDYRKFQAHLRSDTLLYFAKAAKEACNYEKLVGAYFGYIFELKSPRLWNTCALDYERVFNSPYIDMIANPISYEYRRQDDASCGMVADTSLAKSGKICFYEHDQTTSIVPDIIEGVRFVHPCKVKTVEEDINLLRRDFLLSSSRGCASWWFDMFGGWFYDNRFMDEISNMVSITNRLFEKGYSNTSEICFIADPESMYHVNKTSKLNEMLLMLQRQGLSQIGAPYDLYTACDIESIDYSKYKFIIFADSFKITESQRRVIEKLQSEKKALLFIYGADCVDENGEINLEKSNDLLDMKLCVNPSEEQEIFTDTQSFSCFSQSFSCFAIDEDPKITVVARYKNSSKTAIGYTKNEVGTITAFSGLGNLDGYILREFARLSGVHLYGNDDNNALYISHDFIGVYHKKDCDCFITLRDNEHTSWTDLFENKQYTAKDNVLHIPYDGIRAKLLIPTEI